MNATRVRALKIAGLYEDGGGLRLVVTDTGAKRWVMRISVRGKRHQLGLGSYPTVSLERAREKAADIRKAASEGRNILAERRAGKQGAVTFRQAFETFFASKGPTLSNGKHRAQWRSTMESYAFPIIGDRPVAEVQPDEVLTIMRPLWSSKPETAGRVLQRTDAVLHFAIANNWRERPHPGSAPGKCWEAGAMHATSLSAITPSRACAKCANSRLRVCARFIPKVRRGGLDQGSVCVRTKDFCGLVTTANGC
jgi:hypothetical protein